MKDFSLFNLTREERMIFGLIENGTNFLKQFDIDHKHLLDTISLTLRYLRLNNKIPLNLYEFFVAAYYIISRHPFAFLAHETKKDFCKKFGTPIASFEYCVDKITTTINYIRILDELNFPYFIDPKRDICLGIIRKMVKNRLEKVMMRFLLYHEPVNSQIITDELVCEAIFKQKAFPEEFFRQLFEIIFELVEKEFVDYYEYVRLQQKYF